MELKYSYDYLLKKHHEIQEHLEQDGYITSVEIGFIQYEEELLSYYDIYITTPEINNHFRYHYTVCPDVDVKTISEHINNDIKEEI